MLFLHVINFCGNLGQTPVYRQPCICMYHLRPSFQKGLGHSVIWIVLSHRTFPKMFRKFNSIQHIFQHVLQPILQPVLQNVQPMLVEYMCSIHRPQLNSRVQQPACTRGIHKHYMAPSIDRFIDVSARCPDHSCVPGFPRRPRMLDPLKFINHHELFDHGW